LLGQTGKKMSPTVGTASTNEICGMQDIVQGSLRLAAHQVLGEEPHFGGKYSKRLIDQGMAAIERANGPPPPPPKPLTKKQLAEQKAAWADVKDVPAGDVKPEPRRKKWSLSTPNLIAI
jgi:hypothetical protein